MKGTEKGQPSVTRRRCRCRPSGTDQDLGNSGIGEIQSKVARRAEARGRCSSDPGRGTHWTKDEETGGSDHSNSELLGVGSRRLPCFLGAPAMLTWLPLGFRALQLCRVAPARPLCVYKPQPGLACPPGVHSKGQVLHPPVPICGEAAMPGGGQGPRGAGSRGPGRAGSPSPPPFLLWISPPLSVSPVFSPLCSVSVVLPHSFAWSPSLLSQFCSRLCSLSFFPFTASLSVSVPVSVSLSSLPLPCFAPAYLSPFLGHFPGSKPKPAGMEDFLRQLYS